jgi:hypothetical protein
MYKFLKFQPKKKLFGEKPFFEREAVADPDQRHSVHVITGLGPIFQRQLSFHPCHSSRSVILLTGDISLDGPTHHLATTPA